MRAIWLAKMLVALSTIACPAYAENKDEPPKPLSPRALSNLEAFAALYGDVRFFHPSDAVASADWDALAIVGVEHVELAADQDALATALRDVFQPIAPTLRIYAAERGIPPPDEALGKCSGGAVEWRHRGVKLTPAQAAYSDERVVTSGEKPEVTRLTLAPGVEALLPVTLCRDPAGLTLPRTERPPLLPSRPPSFKPTGNDRKTRLADVVILWSVLQQFYPYFDVTKVNWKMELAKSLRAAATDKDDQAFADTLSRLVAALKDGHGNVYHTKHRILPVVWATMPDRLIVTAKFPDAGDLRLGDEVTVIDGHPVKGLIEKIAPTVSGATPQWRRFKTLQLLSETAADEMSARIEGVHADGVTFTTLVPTIAGRDYKAPPAPPRPTTVAQLKPGVMYVDLSRLTKEQLSAHLLELVAARAVILDMRDYPTGDAYDLFPHLSGRHLHSARFQVPIRTRPDQVNVTYDASGSWDLSPSVPQIHGKLLMLTGPGAISYAESLAGIFEGERLGVIIGEPTAGTNGNITSVTLPGGYSALFTGMRVVKQDGSRHHGVGIIPQITVHPSLAGIRAGRDEVLERAIMEAGRP